MKLNEKTFNAALKTITGTGEKLASSIHDAGCFAIAQANEHGNIGFAVRLRDAMGKKHDAQRVVTWLCHFGKIGVKDGMLVYRKRKDIQPENMDAWLVKAEATPYWEFTKQKQLIEKIDYLAMLKSISTKHKNAQIKLDEGGQVVESNVGVLIEVEKLLAKLTAKAAPAQAQAV